MATVGGRVLSLVLALGLASTVGCGVKKTSNRKSDGVIVQTSKESQEEIQKLFPENKVTVINKADHLYKIKDADTASVKDRMPASHVEEDFLLNMNPNQDISTKDALLRRASIQTVISKLDCIKMKTGGPVANVQLVNRPKFVARNTVEVNSTPLEVTSAGSMGPNSLDLHWVVEAPPGSMTLDESTDKTVTVSFDRPGGYIVALIVQDPETHGCDLTGEMLGATMNKKFDGGDGTKGNYSAQKFFHVPLVKADKAWSVSQGEGVTIAILDSGVNYNHPDLAENIKINKDEIPDNGIDDDHNGFVDDVYGWDFAIGDAYPFDDESHGTHVSGLAASSVSGIAKKAKILPIKAMLPTGMGSTSAIVSGIYYAIQQKADIINMSLGGEGNASPVLLAAIQKAQAAGILIVAASGNSTIDADTKATFLTSKDGSNILAVAATDEYDHLTNYSNYGLRTVDIAAPGGTTEHPLVSTYAQTDLSKYIAYPGTSMASPVTAGAAALVKAVNPNLSAEQLKAVLMKSVKRVSSLEGKVTSGGVLDAEAAVLSAHSFSFLASH